MMRHAPRRCATTLAYTPAALLGLASVVYLLPWATIAGTGGLWTQTGGDAAQGLTGHLAFQAPGWHWPLLLAPDLAWPAGRSIAMTDSNPLMSLPAKVVSAIAGHPVNFLGIWLAACCLLQPIAGVYAFRGFEAAQGRVAREPLAGLAAAAFSLMLPAWYARMRHLNLFGHFLLLAALGLTLRMLGRERGQDWWLAGALLCAAVLVHPYLFVFDAILLGAPALLRLRQASRPRWRPVAAYALTCSIPVVLLWILSGTLGGSAPGFGHYSMNLLSPVWPQNSGLFGASLPILDATGGQYEGFNYLGAGGLLLVGMAVVLLTRQMPSDVATRRRLGALLAALAALALLALTPRIYAGDWLILPMPTRPFSAVFGAVQASGRAFWPVAYAAILGAIACLTARLPRQTLHLVLAAAIGLQLVDTGPVRALAKTFFAGDTQVAPPFDMPAGARLLRIVPPCDPVNRPADVLRLLAIRAGLHLADMRMSRPAPGYDCQAAFADGLEMPLASGELRVFLPDAANALRLAALGTGTVCTRVDPVIVCSRDLPRPPSGPAAAPGRPPPVLPPGPAVLTGDAMGAALSFGWRLGAEGIFWSQGTCATILFRRPPGQTAAATLALTLDAIAATAGGTLTVEMRVDGGTPSSIALADLRPFTLPIKLPEGSADQPDRIVFAIRQPVKPGRRGLAAPVTYAALRLRSLAWQPAAPPVTR